MIDATPTSAASLANRLERRLDVVHGRDRISAEFHRLAIDVVGRAEHDELDPAAKALLHHAMERAILRTEIDVADRFIRELADALAETPDDLFDRLARAEIRRDLGLD
ncbi:MAG: hypothetical protein WCH74_02220 [Chloroflexota bacterium]